MRRRRTNYWIWLIPLLLLVVGIGGYAFFLQSNAESEADNAEPPLQTSTVRRGEILISATGAGTIIPANTTDLAFTTSGILSELNVQVGDRIAIGDEVAALVNTDLQKAISDAEISLRQIKLSLDDDMLARSIELAEIQVRLAELSLAAAQSDLDSLLAWEPDADPIAIASAQLNLANAKNNLARVVNSSGSNDLDIQQARLNVTVAENNLNKVRNSNNNSALDIQSAQLALNQAQTALNTTRSQGVTDASTSVATAELNVAAAQRALNELTNWTPDWDEVKILQVNYQTALQNLQNAQAQAGVSGASIVSARVALDNAKQAVVDAQAAVDLAYDPAREWETLSHDCKSVAANGSCTQTFSEAIERERESADDNLARQKQNLEIAQASYDIAVANNGNSAAITSAQSNVASAEKALKDAQEGPDESELQAARDTLRIQQLNLQNVQDNVVSNNTNYQNELVSAESQVQQAQLGLQVQQANAAASASSYELDVFGSQLSLQQSQLSLQILQQTLGSNTSTDITSAEISVAQAELALREALLATDEEAETIAEQVAAAERGVEQAKLALRQAEINLIETQDNSQAELSLLQAQLNLDNALAKANEAVLVSPVAGTVTAISAQVGTAVGTAALVSVANLDGTVIEMYFDETDIDKVSAENDVEIIFDAMPEETFTGRVTLVDPQLVVNSGVTTVRALAILDNDIFSSAGQLAPGMNATVDVIGGRATNALIVPIEALRELSADSFAVFVLEEGEPRLRMVEVGLRDFAFAEITSGLEQGEVVTTGIAETQ